MVHLDAFDPVPFFRVVESGLHASLKEVLDTLSDDETIRIISKVVHAEALEGSRAAITESESLPTLCKSSRVHKKCSCCPSICARQICTNELQT